MGTRYGGLKQVDPVGPSGEAILDYSVHDALRAGFGKIVFVIREDFADEFKEKIGSKYAGLAPVEYCHQDISDIPAPFSVPAGRSKPWGTAHATRAARRVVDGPFAVINADDFYGRDAFAKLGAFLSNAKDAPDGVRNFAMVGFSLENTLSENGSVARGICSVDSGGMLERVEEMTKIVRAGDMAEDRREDGTVKIPLDALVSMNLWGFTPGFFEDLERMFPAWLAENATSPKAEWYLPFAVDSLVREGKARCSVLPTPSKWFGVTYREDRPAVAAAIKALVEAGEYPARLAAK